MKNLKVFGCLCYSKINRSTKKFETRAIKGVFLGHATLISKGYRILDIETLKIFISRDVIFHEDTLSFKNKIKNKRMVLKKY